MKSAESYRPFIDLKLVYLTVSDKVSSLRDTSCITSLSQNSEKHIQRVVG